MVVAVAEAGAVEGAVVNCLVEDGLAIGAIRAGFGFVCGIWGKSCVVYRPKFLRFGGFVDGAASSFIPFLIFILLFPNFKKLT